MVIQQYEKAKVIQDEQLERLTQICQEQGVMPCHSRVCPEPRAPVMPKTAGDQNCRAPEDTWGT